MVIKAPSIEVVRDILYESRYSAYVDARIYPTTPLAELAAPRRTVWLSGKMSPRAKKEFEALGWTVQEGTAS